MNLIEALNWRYATKRMTGERVDEQIIAQIVEAARLAPTSSGLQPLHLFVISDPKTKEEILPIAFNQPQITEASHLLVFASWDKISDERIEERFAAMNAYREIPRETTFDYENRLKSLYQNQSSEEHYHQTAKQAYIAMAMAMAAAAELGVDTTPMEGFDKAALDTYLKLQDKGLRSVLILTVGKRDTTNDWLYPMKKFRLSTEEFVTEIK